MVSLDGFVEGPNRELDWGIIDEELHTFINDQHRAIDTYLFGRRMYEVMVYWDTADTDPSNPEYALEFARIWKDIHKIVFSQTLEQVQGNATLSKGNIVEEIVKLKAQPGKDLGVGGATIAATLMRSWPDRRILALRSSGDSGERHTHVPGVGQQDQLAIA